MSDSKGKVVCYANKEWSTKSRTFSLAISNRLLHASVASSLFVIHALFKALLLPTLFQFNSAVFLWSSTREKKIYLETRFL